MGDDVVLESDLLDVSDLDLDRLNELPEQVFRASLKRILRERVDLPARYSIYEPPTARIRNSSGNRGDEE